MLRKTIAGAVTLASAVLGLGATTSGAEAAADDRAPLITAESRVIDGQYIVMLDEGMSSATVKAAADRARGHGAEVRNVYSKIDGYSAALTQSELDAVRNDPAVAYVEQDQVMSGADTQINPTWGLDRIDQRNLPLSGVYTYSANLLDGLGVSTYSATGRGVNAYIIDTGLNATHNEFTGRVGNGYTAISDGRGTGDCNGHGTHVSGTVAGTTYGVAKKATVIPVRVLDCQGSGKNSGVIAGMDWVAGRSAASPRVANVSMGGDPSTATDDAINRMVNAGVTVAVSAGNEDQDACNVSPARAASAITVASSTRTDARSTFSNWGSCVDLFAPGSDITSAWINSNTATNIYSGTSMASPHVAGAAALYLQGNPSASPAAVTSALVGNSTANKISDPKGSPNRLLAVSIIASAPSNTPATKPGRVAKPTVRVDGRKAIIKWRAPRDGGSPLTGYRVTVNGKARTIGPSVPKLVLNRLRPRRYTVTVAAINRVSVGPASDIANFRIRAS
ncbi:MAG: S8 family serine peptidase [Nocardioides sp.]